MSGQLIDVEVAEAVGWLVERQGPWIALATFGPSLPGGGLVILGRRMSRCAHGDYQKIGEYDVFRFPAGWRQGSIDRDSGIPETAKRLARKAMNRLP